MEQKKTKNNKLFTNTFDRLDMMIIFVSIVTSLFIVLAMGEKSYDDAYITFRYARNIASGNGFVYNLGEQFLGTTTPFYTLLLATISMIFSIESIPVIGQWVTGIALSSLSFLTYLLAKDNGKLLAGIVSALFILFNPIFVTVWGGESIFFLALLVGATFFYFRGRRTMSTIIVGLAFLTRGEGILLGIILFVHYMFWEKRVPWRMVLAFSVVVIPWMFYSFNTFGVFFPSTLHAKIAQMDSGLWSPFFITTLDMLSSYVIGSPHFPNVVPQYGYLVVIIFAGLGVISLFSRPKSPTWIIIIWLITYSAGYSFLDVPFYHWYSVPLLFGGILLAGSGVQFVCDLLYKRANNKLYSGIIVVIFLAFPLWLGFNAVIEYVTQPVSHIQKLYSNTGRWLQKNTLPNESIGYFEIGYLGYYSDRTIIDPAGLVNLGTAEQVASRNFKWGYLYYKPDYLVINPVRWYDRLGSIRDETWFDKAYKEVGEIKEDGYFDAPVTIYKKINDKAIPSP